MKLIKAGLLVAAILALSLSVVAGSPECSRTSAISRLMKRSHDIFEIEDDGLGSQSCTTAFPCLRALYHDEPSAALAKNRVRDEIASWKSNSCHAKNSKQVEAVVHIFEYDENVSQEVLWETESVEEIAGCRHQCRIKLAALGDRVHASMEEGVESTAHGLPTKKSTTDKLLKKLTLPNIIAYLCLVLIAILVVLLILICCVSGAIHLYNRVKEKGEDVIAEATGNSYEPLV